MSRQDVAGTKRLRLKPENLECLLFLKYNLRSLNGEKRAPPEDFEAPNSRILPTPVLSESRQSEEETSDIDISDTEADTETDTEADTGNE